jgi:transposase InsO family protein
MKSRLPRIGLGKLCEWFGITRQAYYQNIRESFQKVLEVELIIQEVGRIRIRHPRIGTRKLHNMLQHFFAELWIKLGRDGLFDLLSAHYLLICRKRRTVKTTNSFHYLGKYPNVIKGFIPTAPNQLWVSDITYWRVSEGKFLYISFITDAYSHKIVGYHVANTLEAVESVQALQMALSSLGESRHLQLVHHSDRGLQYCSHIYVNLLKKNNIKINALCY